MENGKVIVGPHDAIMIVPTGLSSPRHPTWNLDHVSDYTFICCADRSGLALITKESVTEKPADEFSLVTTEGDNVGYYVTVGHGVFNQLMLQTPTYLCRDDVCTEVVKEK